MEKDQSYYNWLQMRKHNIILLFLWYLLSYLILISIAIYFQYFDIGYSLPLVVYGTIFCVSSCLLYYIRKLYKHLIRGEISFIKNGEPISVFELGSMFYLIARPFTSIVFGILTFYILEVFVRSNITTSQVYSNGYVMFVVIIEFFCGFSIGRFVERTEVMAIKILNSLFSKVGE